MDRRTPVYPIRTAARLTGTHPRRLRVWEEMYGLLSPGRTDGDHRLYSEDDLDRIRWIKARVDEGMSLKGIQQAEVRR